MIFHFVMIYWYVEYEKLKNIFFLMKVESSLQYCFVFIPTFPSVQFIVRVRFLCITSPPLLAKENYFDSKITKIGKLYRQVFDFSDWISKILFSPNKTERKWHLKRGPKVFLLSLAMKMVSFCFEMAQLFPTSQSSCHLINLLFPKSSNDIPNFHLLFISSMWCQQHDDNNTNI